MNRTFPVNPQSGTGDRFLPACVDAEAAARFLGWPAYFMPLLARVGHLKPLGKPGQNALMNRSPNLRVDIVISGLPNQTEPLAGALLDALQPQLIVITDSEYPASQRASPKLRARLAAREAPVLYTRETGAITLTLAKGRWIARAMSGREVSNSIRRER